MSVAPPAFEQQFRATSHTLPRLPTLEPRAEDLEVAGLVRETEQMNIEQGMTKQEGLENV
jgi:hypothetical protein